VRCGLTPKPGFAKLLQMAVFQYHNHSISYSTEFAPFAQDLILLQSSKFNQDFWRPVREELADFETGPGRVMVCEWGELSTQIGERAQIFARLLATLGLHDPHVVAFGDAVDLVAELQRKESVVFVKTLLFPQGGPKGDELKRVVREFVGL
jgi:hypothetical protein